MSTDQKIEALKALAELLKPTIALSEPAYSAVVKKIAQLADSLEINK